MPKSSISMSMPRFLDLLDVPGDQLVVLVEEDRFDQLERDRARLDAELAQAADQFLVMQPAGRDVDRGLGDVEARGRPVVEVPQRLLEDHAVDGADDVEFLGDLHEGGGRQQALGRVVPAGQRLDADDGMGGGVELRLVVGDELVALEPRQDVVGDALGRDDLGLQRLVEELVAVAAAALGPVEREIGIDEQAARIGAGLEVAGDADGNTEAALMALVGDRLVHLRR